MKNYTVYVNIEWKRFFSAQWELLGTTSAKNKSEAIRLVYDAVWGADNDARILSDGFIIHYVTPNRSFKAEINT